MVYLTEKQKLIFNFIKDYLEKNDMPPSYTEIKEYFGFSSLNTVNDHIENLIKKGYITKGLSNQKRSIALADQKKTAVSIPLVGLVRAGEPIDANEITEYMDVPEEILASGENVALRVTGNSMIESNICDGDIIIVRRQNTAENGQIVVALIDNRATVKEIHFHKKQIELRPRNPEMKPIFVDHGDFGIYGILVGMYRKY